MLTRVIGGDFLEHGGREFLRPHPASAEQVLGLLMVSSMDVEANCGNIYAVFFLPWVSRKELK